MIKELTKEEFVQEYKKYKNAMFFFPLHYTLSDWIKMGARGKFNGKEFIYKPEY